MVDYIQKDGTTASVTAMQYPDLNVLAEVGEAVAFQQFPSMKDASHAGHDNICPVLRAFTEYEEDHLGDQMKQMIPPRAESPQRQRSQSAPNASDQLYGRVTNSEHNAIQVVYVTDEGKYGTKVFRPPFPSSLKITEVGHAVLLQRYKNCEVKYITTFSPAVEYDLYTQGVFFPEAPPELHPGGYYG